ncbi:MAG: hypothetical protein JO202_20090, partial [Ktedonobacteraceae bacterium]|nr:hypothetical protein [Ktedonobacteraceae bacterium]
GHIASTPPTAVPTKGRTSTATPIANVTPPPVPTGGGTSTATAIPGVTPTPCAIGEGTPPSQIYSCATKGRPVLDDTLQAQNADNWSTGSKPNGSCAFVNQAYQVTTTFPDYYQLCVAQTSSFGKFAFQVDMSILSGDAGGLIFRSNSSHFYAFTFCSEQSTCGGLGVGGYYALYAIDVSAAPGLRLVGQNVKSAALNPRLGVSNTLAVVALGNDIYLYANGQYVDYAPNIGLSVGQIGVTAYDPKGSSALTQVAFSNAKVWQL